MSGTDRSAEFVIVGGGIAGCALAYFLAEGGAERVVVVDAGPLGGGATAHSMGGVRQQFSTALEVQLSLRALAFWRGVEERFGSHCPFHEDGYLFLTGRADLFAALQEAAELQRSLGAGPVEILTPTQLHDLAPWIAGPDLAGAAWTPHDGRVNPTDGVVALVAAARRLGVEFRESWPVSRLEPVDGGVIVHGPDRLEAEQVVLAAGLGTPRLAAAFGAALDIRPQLLHYATTEAALTGHAIPLTIDLDTGLLLEREGDGLVVTVLLEAPPAGYNADDMLAAFAAAAEHRVPSLSSVGVRSTATGTADLSPDGHPYVGRLAERAWVLAGFSGHGTMHGPVLAELLAGSMLGSPPGDLDLAPLAPLRPPAAATETEWMIATQKGEAVAQPHQ